METERRIEKWNGRWSIVAGRAVCNGCLESQALEDCEIPFSHGNTCPARDAECLNPWTALHDILDSARG